MTKLKPVRDLNGEITLKKKVAKSAFSLNSNTNPPCDKFKQHVMDINDGN